MQRTKQDERKADTRNKIQLGGLVVKAGLGEEETAVLLGAFIEAADALNGPNGVAIRRRFRRRGDAAFKEDQRDG